MKIVDKLALNPKVDTFMIEIARAGLLKFGRLSVPYLVRKLKVCPSTAKAIIEATRRAS